MTKFDPTKPVQTRDGRKAEIWKEVDGEMWGASESKGGGYGQRSWELPTGDFCHAPQGSIDDDLINIPEEPITIKRWAVATRNGTVMAYYQTRQAAAEHAAKTMICRVVLLSGTFTPGEGLDDD